MLEWLRQNDARMVAMRACYVYFFINCLLTLLTLPTLLTNRSTFSPTIYFYRLNFSLARQHYSKITEVFVNKEGQQVKRTENVHYQAVIARK